MTKGSKKKELEKCFVCKHSYKAEEIDEHMNGMTHHRILEELYEKSRPHHCLACECVWNGLQLYRRHVSSAEHKKNIAELGKQRRKGLPVHLSYSAPPELISRCKQRNKQENVQKNQRRQEKLKARKAKQQGKAWTSKPTSLQTKQDQSKEHQDNRSNLGSDGRSLGPTLSPGSPCSSVNKDNQLTPTQPRGNLSSPLGDGATSSCAGSTSSDPQSSGSVPAAVKSCCGKQSVRQLSSEIDFSLDFTSDLLPPVGAMLFALQPGDRAKPSKTNPDIDLGDGVHTKQSDSPKGKRLLQVTGSKKRPLYPGKTPLSSPEPGQQEDLPRAPGLVKAHVKHISSILKRIRRSLDEEGLSLQQSTSSGSASTADADGGTRPAQVKRLRKETLDEVHIGDEKSGEVAEDDPALPTLAPSRAELEEATLKLVKDDEHDQSSHSSSVTKAAGCSSNGGVGSIVCHPSQSQSRPGLPELLKRDLSRISAKGGAHEPNLTAARRVRTLSSSQAGEVEREPAASAVIGPGLKPTLEKLINSNAAKRRVNWREIYQEHYKRKRLREKGTPRFGIELVSPVMPLPDGVELEEVQDLQLGKDFHWDSLEFDEASGAGLPIEDPPDGGVLDSEAPKHAGSADVDTPAGQADGQQRPLPVVRVKMEKDDWGEINSQGVSLPVEAESQSEDDDLEEPRKESQIDELLAVSLREEELSHSLLNLEDSLTKARSALQDAYSKVQRLLLVRDQTANDINTLRTKRIEILKVMRGRSHSDDANTEQAVPAVPSVTLSQPPVISPLAPRSPIGSPICASPSVPPALPSSSGQASPATLSVPTEGEASSRPWV